MKSDHAILKVPELSNRNYYWYSSAPSFERIEKQKNNSRTVPYFYAGAVNKNQVSESIIPGGFPFEDLDKMAAYYHVLVVFSYEIVQR